MTQVSIVANMAIVATVVTQQYQQNLGECSIRDDSRRVEESDRHIKIITCLSSCGVAGVSN